MRDLDLRWLDSLLEEDLDLARAGVAGGPRVGHDRRPRPDARAGGCAVDLLDVLVHSGLVGRAFDERRLDVGSLDPILDVVHEEIGDLVGISIQEELRQVVVGVDPGARDHLQAALLGDALHEADVASQKHRGRLTDCLDAELHGRLRLTYSDVEDLIGRDLVRLVFLDRPDDRPLVAHRLVGVPQMLVDQRGAELLRLDRPGHGLHLRHGPAKPIRIRARGRGMPRCVPASWRGPVTAERVGFEPTRRFNPPTRFPSELLKPLGHLSGLDAV